MRIPRWLVVLGPSVSVLVALFAWSVRPVPYKYAIKQSDGTLVDATESTPGARPVLGASSHVLPLVRVVNALARIYRPESQERNLRLWETLNKIRQWQAGTKQRFLLKAPEHLFGLPRLVQDHPDASIISVSRDEASWYPSQLVMAQLWRYMYVDAEVQDAIAFTDRLLCTQRESLEVAHNGTFEVLPVEFGSYLFTQTRDVVERIAKHADLTWDEATQARAADVIAKRLAWKKKAYYRTDEFGLSRSAISERLGTVCDHYRNSMSSRYFKDPDYVCREPGDCLHESLRSK